MPEVGLERDSEPCKHWEPMETCGIRPDPMAVRGSPRWKVWTLSTLLFARLSTEKGARVASLRTHGLRQEIGAAASAVFLLDGTSWSA